MSRSAYFVVGGGTLLLLLGFALLRQGDANATRPPSAPRRVELLNVSYDPTRELWRDLNARFSAHYERQRGVRVSISQSHGGSSSQARGVIDGLEADVVTLALWPDLDAIRRAGLITSGWERRLPNSSVAYYSTLVFVVRKGNPKSIRDWPDLVNPGVEVITPNPKTSGNGKLSFLAAWAGTIRRGGSEEAAVRYVTELYKHVPVLDSGARAATTTFSQKKIGDVHLTWENEAHLEVQESKGALELVYPSVSIRAEPPVAWVDANVGRKGTADVAEAYLAFLFSKEAQEVLAAHFYRPIDPEVAKEHSARFPHIELVSLRDLGLDWDEANARFFGEGGVFDRIYLSKK
jgi:sulfate transport system substrate-binding protein